MTKKQVIKWQKEIAFWGNGGNLWWYSHNHEEWRKWGGNISFTSDDKASYIIEDKHFEARKAFALGEPIECAIEGYENWEITTNPSWNQDYKYRSKPKECSGETK